MKNVLKLLAKSVLIPLGLTAAATDAAIQKKIFGSGISTLTISNEEMNDVMKIIKSIKDASLLIKDVSETIENEPKKTKTWISRHVIRYTKCYFIRKSINR